MHSRCSTEAYSIRITHLDWLIGNHHSWYLEVFAAEVAGCVYSTTTTTTKMRRLTLHTSALNDAEYDLYTSSIQDLALVDSNLSNGRDDTFYEQISLGVREVRAWLRGRYQDTPVNTIDAVCARPMVAQSYICLSLLYSDPQAFLSDSLARRNSCGRRVLCCSQAGIARPERESRRPQPCFRPRYASCFARLSPCSSSPISASPFPQCFSQ